MKKASTGVVSGCLVWILAFGVISTCIVPVFMAIGSITSVTDFAINTTGKFICPDGTTPESYSYATTTRDEYGNSKPTTAYELQCVDTGGEVLKTDPIGYSFLWIGIFVLVGLLVTGGLAFLLAAPAGVLITRLFNRAKKTNITENVEPK
jgi:ABC-type glycerol-3-phosphate transport system permease component